MIHLPGPIARSIHHNFRSSMNTKRVSLLANPFFMFQINHGSSIGVERESLGDGLRVAAIGQRPFLVIERRGRVGQQE